MDAIINALAGLLMHAKPVDIQATLSYDQFIGIAQFGLVLILVGLAMTGMIRSGFPERPAVVLACAMVASWARRDWQAAWLWMATTAEKASSNTQPGGSCDFRPSNSSLGAWRSARVQDLRPSAWVPSSGSVRCQWASTRAWPAGAMVVRRRLARAVASRR